MAMFPSLDGFKLHEVSGDLFRNIVSLRTSEDLFDDLSADPDDWQHAQTLEMTTKPPAFLSHQPVIDRPFEEPVFFEAIGFPFDNWSETRFSNGSFGVWYGCPELSTTVHETVYHWRNGLLGDVGLENEIGVAVERRVHLVQCQADLIDLIPAASAMLGLVSNDYAFCHTLGDRIHSQGHPGLWTPSARCDGANAAIFNSRVLSNPRPFCYLTYTIASAGVEVERAPGSLMMTVP